MFCKNVSLRNFAKFTGKHLCRSLFFNKVAGLMPQLSLMESNPVAFYLFIRFYSKFNERDFNNLHGKMFRIQVLKTSITCVSLLWIPYLWMTHVFRLEFTTGISFTNDSQPMWFDALISNFLVGNYILLCHKFYIFKWFHLKIQNYAIIIENNLLQKRLIVSILCW